MQKEEKDWPIYRHSNQPLTLVCLFASFFLSLIPDSLTVTDSLKRSTNYPWNVAGRGQSTWHVQSPMLSDNGLQSSDLGKSSCRCWQLFDFGVSIAAGGGGGGGGGRETQTERQRERASTPDRFQASSGWRNGPHRYSAPAGVLYPKTNSTGQYIKHNCCTSNAQIST